jgi:hypothetical protein
MFINRLRKYLTPIILFWAALLCYGIYIPWFGFYGDDWSYVWYQHLLGWGGPGSFAALDRPLSAPFYNIVMTLLGQTPLPYHILNLLLRWLCSVLLWWILRMIWKGKERQATWVALIMVVFPGFSQQPIAVEFILHFFVLATYLFSVGGMIVSLRNPRYYWLWTIISIIAAANMFSLEYFVGLELLRPLIIWIIISEKDIPIRARLKQAILAWLPYLVLLAAFSFWRIFIFKFPTYQPTILSDLLHSPAAAGIALFKRILKDLVTVLYGAWRQVLVFPKDQAGRLVYLGLFIISILSFGFLLRKYKSKKDDGYDENQGRLWNEWAWSPILLGGFSLLLAGWPFWISNIQVELFFPWDRTILPFMLGASLVMVGLIELFVKTRFRTLFLVILVSLAVGYHFQNAQIYRDEWARLEQFFWQLSWRAPGLKTGTVLVSDDIPLFRYSDNNLNGPFNWTYAPDQHSHQIAYKFFDLFIRYGTEYSGIPAFEEGLPITHDYRTLTFSSSTSDLLVVYDNPNACLRVSSPDDGGLPGLTNNLYLAIPLSKLDHIITDANPPAHPPVAMYPEPVHSWCYYFQKMDLARQIGNWQGVVDSGEEAQEKSFVPVDLSEWLPLVEGYAHLGNWQQARDYSEKIMQEPALLNALCSTWQKISNTVQISQEETDALNFVKESANCSY